MAEKLPTTGLFDLDAKIEVQEQFTCGYASMAALLRFQRYEYNQYDLFAKDHGEPFNREKENHSYRVLTDYGANRDERIASRPLRAGAPGLVTVTREVSVEEREFERIVRSEMTEEEIARYRDPTPLPPLKVELYDHNRFEQTERRNPLLTPPKILELFVVKRKVPVAVRTTAHWRVIQGIDYDTGKNGRYITAEPLNGRRETVDRGIFDERWAAEEDKDIGADTRYLMIVVFPDPKAIQKS